MVGGIKFGKRGGAGVGWVSLLGGIFPVSGEGAPQ